MFLYKSSYWRFSPDVLSSPILPAVPGAPAGSNVELIEVLSGYTVRKGEGLH